MSYHSETQQTDQQRVAGPTSSPGFSPEHSVDSQPKDLEDPTYYFGSMKKLKSLNSVPKIKLDFHLDAEEKQLIMKSDTMTRQEVFNALQ